MNLRILFFAKYINNLTNIILYKITCTCTGDISTFGDVRIGDDQIKRSKCFVEHSQYSEYEHGIG